MKNDVIEDLFLKYYNDAMLYTLSLTKNRELSEEIVSEAFFKALKTADDEIQNFKAWLLMVCRNLFLNNIRKNKRLCELDEDLTEDGETVLGKIIKKDEYAALFKAILQLKPAQKEVITLFYYEDLSVKEISLITKKSESDIKITLFRARRALKDILEKEIKEI